MGKIPLVQKISQTTLTPVILATWKTEIGRIAIQGQPRQIVQEIPISTITSEVD
jgi:hypothetical protein